MRTRILIIGAIWLLQHTAFSQITKDYWSPVQPKSESPESTWIQASKYSTTKVEYQTLYNLLTHSRNSEQEISLPDPNGEFHTFRIKPMEIFEPGLKTKYPGYESYYGYEVDNPSTKIGLSFSPFGLTASVMRVDGTSYYLDPLQQNDSRVYMIYDKEDIIRPATKTFFCKKSDFSFDKDEIEIQTVKGQSGTRAGDCQLRTYRLALACTGEYATFHGGTVEKVLAAFQVAVTRVNTVYRKEIGITFTLVDDVDKIIFLNANTDPYTNTNESAMLSQNQTTVDNLIGRANYDIGHVFGTGDGGIASLGSVCSNNRKAQGVTGRPSPQGDAFFIDYVAHEMGHQFRANHTQNNSCSRNSSTAVETGSGSTIMGYAGICPPNVQNNSHDYFHSISLSEISGFILSQQGCGTVENLMNNRPVLTLDKTSHTIPISTPFYLKAKATDVNQDAITYSWEQMNSETGSMPPKSNNSSGPMFRSVPPSEDPTRYFPDLKGKYGQWEVLPSINRTMSFRAMVRDNSEAGGCTMEQTVSVRTDNVAGPFTVTEPNTPSVVWQAGNQTTITWNVANTTASPVSCQIVDIRLSLDGGISYPVLLASSVPNTGLADVTVPNTPTTSARVMVVAADNIFYDISNFSFRINSSFDINFESIKEEICNQTAVFPFMLTSLNPGTVHAVKLSVKDNPNNLIITLPDTIRSLPAEDIVEVRNNSLPPGIYSFTLEVKDGIYTENIILETVVRDAGQALVLTSPSSGHKVSSTTQNINLIWETDPSNQYELEISTDLTFPDTNTAQYVLPSNEFVWSGSQGTYFWRVRGLSDCEHTPWSQPFVFYKGNKQAYNQSFVRQNLLVVASGEKKDIEKHHLLIDYEETDPFVFTLVNPTLHGHLLLANGSGHDTLKPGQQFYSADIKNHHLSYHHSGNDAQSDNFTFYIENNQFWQGIYTFPIQIIQHISPAVHIEIVEDVLCFGDSGLVRFYLENLSLPLEYKLNGDTQFQILTTEMLRLSGGNHSFDIVSGLGDTMTTNLVQMTAPALLTNHSNQVFYDIEIITSGGAGITRQFALGNGAFGDKSVFEDLTSGEYITFVRDVNGCIASDTVEMMVNPFTITRLEWMDSLDCASDSTLVSIELSGGFPPYQFENNIYETTALQFSAIAGQQIIRFTDAGGKSIDTVITIFAPEPLHITIETMRDEAIWQATGGTPPYVYSFDNEQFFSEDFATDLANGQYTMYVKDDNGCIASVDFEVNLLQSVKINITSPLCFGDAGKIQVMPENGTMPLYVGLDKNQLDSNLIIEPLLAGDYVLYVVDGLGDSIEQAFFISQPDSLEIRFDIQSDTVTILPSGGTPPYLYSVDGGFNYFPINTYYEVPEGKHTVLVKDANGCIGENEFEILSSTSYVDRDQQVRLFPNPVDNILTLEWKNQFANRTNLKMFDAQSREIVFKTISENQHIISIDVALLPSGMYFMSWIQNNQTKVVKFVKR